MFTDIQDFSKRMSAQEQLGMEILRQHNEIMDGAILKHHGTLVKNIGDAYLVDFGSAVNAVNAAIEAQRQFAETNRNRSQLDQILVRISIHLGDVVVQGNDMFGDGVNIASRLQSLTPPGGICISREVYAHVKSRPDFQCIPLGSHELKGIAEPIEVYQILTSLAPHAVTPVLAKPAATKIPENLSIAVLPFANWSDDKENEYFSDGITEDIITDLAKISTLRVSSRNSVFTFKGKNVDIQKVGAEMNVRYVLEGSVRKAGNRLRITAQLIEAAHNTHLWAERFDRDLQDVFAIQDEISQRIAGELKIRLTKEQEQAITKKGTENLEAYDEYLKGLFHSRRRTKSDLDLAVEHLNRALVLDPNFAAAHSALAFALRFKFAFGLDRDRGVIETAREHAERALALEPQLADALLMKGLLLREEGDVTGAIETLHRLIQVHPGHTQGYAYLGNAYRDVGDFRKAQEFHRRAMELDPKDFFLPYNLWVDSWFGGEQKDKGSLVDRVAALDPKHFLVLMCRSYIACGERNETKALELINACIETDPSHVDSYGVRGYINLAFGRMGEAYADFRYMIDRVDDTTFATVFTLPYIVCLKKFDDALDLIDRATRRKISVIAYGHDAKAVPLMYKGMIQRSRGDASAAAESFRQAKTFNDRRLAQFPSSPTVRSTRALILATLEEYDAAIAELKAVVEVFPMQSQFAFEFARIYALKRDKEQMLLWLQKAIELGRNEYPMLKNDIFFEQYADDPDFLELVDK